MYYVTKDFEFAASHNLREYDGPCQRLHGHNYKIEVTIKSETLDKLGMVIDFSKIKEICNKVIMNKYDHQNLNEHEPFDVLNPTAENMSKIFYVTIANELDTMKNNKNEARVHSVKVWETSNSVAKYKED